MSKYPFFGKRGRPSKVEKEICTKINQLINSGQVKQEDVDSILNTEGIPETQSDLENFHAYLTGESPISESVGGNNTNIKSEEYNDPEPISTEETDYSNIEGADIPPNNKGGIGGDAVDFDPFSEPVIERGYTQGNVGGNTDETTDNGVEFEDVDFEQPENLGDSVANELGGNGEDIPNAEYSEEDIPEPQWSNTVEEEIVEEEAESEESSEPLGGDNLQDMTPAQKRKSAEKTAEALLDMYCNFAPLPFKKWASFKDGKIQKMVLNDQINLNMQLENGVTVKDFIDGSNEQVDEIFTVDEDTRESIKDPLIDVLLEQEIALTPTQRLLMAVGSHVVTMGFSAFQLAQNNKQALETFTKFHKDMKDSGAGQPVSRPATAQTAQEAPVNYAQEFTEHDNESVMNVMKDIENEINKDDDGIIDAEHDPNVTVEEVHEDED